MSKRLLIVTPKFHDYWRSIERAFAELGWDVSSFCYDARQSRREKLFVKLRYELPRKLGAAGDARLAELETRRVIEAVRDRRPDRVLVIKGDRLGEPLFAELDAARLPRTLWLYDELRRTQHTASSLARFDAIATYSHQDAAELASHGRRVAHVPLAFDPAMPYAPQLTREVTLVGARYPKRESILRRLHDAGVPVRAYGREWSAHGFDRLRTWRCCAPPFPTGRDVSLAQSYAIMAGSAATLNVHGDQDGFTMRTFEASGVGGVQLIDRADVVEFYEPGAEVAVFTSDDELVDLARRALTDEAWGRRLRDAARRRTLAEHTFAHRARALEAQWL